MRFRVRKTAHLLERLGLAMAGAAIFLDEEVVALQVVGAVVVLGALAILVWRRQPEEPDLPLEAAEQPL